jgi:uncharacterized protein (DUF952 family)
MKENEVYAICYLHQIDDERNKCLLTGKHLVVIRKGKTHRFPLADIQRIAFDHRRIMLPLVVGGIAAPFSLLAMFTRVTDPWLMLPLFFMSLFALYLGWLGYPALIVQDSIREHDFQLRYVSQNLRAFAAFAHNFIRKQKNRGENLFIYHIADHSVWDPAYQDQKEYAPDSLGKEGFIHASDAQQLAFVMNSGLFTPNKGWVVLTIDPLKVNAEIRYEPGARLPGMHEKPPSHSLFPHIYGPLNLDAVVKVEPLHTFSRSPQ